MDILSHGLWGGAAFGRRNRKYFLWAFALSLLPDTLSEGAFGVLYLLDLGGMPGWANGHPDITAFPVYAQNLYNATHSLLVFALVFALIWAIRRKPLLILLAWALHIVIDIPTHSLALFPTPFLWPVSEYRFNGINWDSPVIMIPDLVLLTLVYFLSSIAEPPGNPTIRVKIEKVSGRPLIIETESPGGQLAGAFSKDSILQPEWWF